MTLPPPPAETRDVDHVIGVVRSTFAQAITAGGGERAKDRLVEILAYGSRARQKSRSDPGDGVAFRIDLLVLIDQERPMDSGVWREMENRLREDLAAGRIGAPVRLTVHDQDGGPGAAKAGSQICVDIINTNAAINTTWAGLDDVF